MDFQDYKTYADECEGKLREYMNSHPFVYLWGASLYGRRMVKFLEMLGYKASGFIVSGGDEVGTTVMGLPVFACDDILKRMENPGIIITARLHNHGAISSRLESLGYTDFFVPDMRMYIHFPKQLQKLTQKEADDYVAASPPVPYRGEIVAEWENILLVCTDAIGDEILNIPFIRNLRENCKPETKIDIVVRTPVAQFMKNCPYIDELIVYDLSQISEVDVRECAVRNKEFAKKYLRNREYDAVFLHGWYNIHLECLFLAIYSSARIRIGFSEHNMPAKEYYNQYYDRFLSLAVKSTEVMHEVERDLSLLEAVGGEVRSKNLELWTTPTEEAFAQDVIGKAGGKTIVAVAPYASDKSRIWDEKNFIELMKRILERYNDVVFIVLGGKTFPPPTKAYSEVTPTGHLLNLIEKTTVGEMIALLKRCNLFIGCNSGPLHIAAAWGVPTVEVISMAAGGNPLEYPSPERYRAWGNEGYVIRPRKALPGCEETCNLGIAHCINQISVGEVFEVVDKILNRRARKGDMV